MASTGPSSPPWGRSSQTRDVASLGTTWARYGVDADGRGTIDPYDPTDAITAMAAYLKASGAPQNWRQALYTYNHSIPYVNAVISLSRLYLGPKPT